MDNQYAENVVLGFATNMAAERVEIFAKTLRHVYSPQECDLVIYTNNVDDELCQISGKYSVNFLYTPNIYTLNLSKAAKLLDRMILYPVKWLAETTCNISAMRFIFHEVYPQLLKLWHHPHFVRWLSYKDFFQTHKNYNRIFLSDVKDVAFQDRFFEKLGGADLHFFEQDVFYGPGDYWDTLWYKSAYGIKELSKVEGKPPLCMGTVMGNLEGIVAFLDIVCRQILETPFKTIDQGVVNHLYYSKNAFNSIPIKVHKNAAEPILLTIASELALSRFEVRANGVFNTDNQIIPVIHMYDRNSETMEYFSRILGRRVLGDGLIRV